MKRPLIAIITFLLFLVAFNVGSTSAAQTEMYVYKMDRTDSVYAKMDRATKATGSLQQGAIFFGQPATASWLYVPNKKGYVSLSHAVRQKGLYTVVQQHVTMFKNATRSAKKVANIKGNNVIIRYTDVAGGWTFASVNGTFGYVPTSVLQAPLAVKTAVYAKDGAALRNAPTKSVAPVSTIPTNTAVTIYNSFAGWSFVAGAGYSGYVPTATVTKTTVPSKPAATKPVKGKKLALTFDDGPHRTVTPQVLATLKKYNVKATFYVVGQEAERNAELLKRIANDGHQIGNHSWAHKDLTKMSIAAAKADLEKANAVIKRITGKAPITYRPPYGAITQKMRTEIPMKPMLWTVDTLDWQHRNAAKTVAAVERGATNGGVVLMHDIHQPTADALVRVITTLQKKGYTFVTVDNL